MNYFIGVDVGTGSARAGLFDCKGVLQAVESQAIQTWRPTSNQAQQSSADIWNAVCKCTRSVLQQTGIHKEDVSGIGFDATCSLVLVDKDGEPVSVSLKGEISQDTILWADHRAIADAKKIDKTEHERLSISGGTISPEMQLPKLRWLKTHLPQSWAKTAHFFDLPDWLTWKATNKTTRSLCSSVCKWTYRGEAGKNGEGWDDSFFREIGLDDLTADGFQKIGTQFLEPGKPLGTLTPQAAHDLGLSIDTVVATSMIDAHAGALGTIGVDVSGIGIERLALIAGTSACHITLSQEPAFVEGVWGPYFGVVLPNIWTNEAGQSMAGAAIDAVINRHSYSDKLKQKATEQNTDVHSLLEKFLNELSGVKNFAFAARDRHILPDFNGNRSPIADPARLGVTWGQSAVPDLEDLAIEYLACIQSLALGTKHILDQMADKDVKPEVIVVSGGLAKNAIYCQAHADANNCPVIIPEQQEPVLLGSAMLASVAANCYPDLSTAMQKMSGKAVCLRPNPQTLIYYENKYRVFRKMHEHFALYHAHMLNKGMSK